MYYRWVIYSHGLDDDNDEMNRMVFIIGSKMAIYEQRDLTFDVRVTKITPE